MAEIRKQYDRRFRERAVRRVFETGKPIAQVAHDLGVNPGTLGNWVAKDRAAQECRGDLSRGELSELKHLRAENSKLRMERDVLKRSVALWVKKAMRRPWRASSPTRGPYMGCHML